MKKQIKRYLPLRFFFLFLAMVILSTLVERFSVYRMPRPWKANTGEFTAHNILLGSPSVSVWRIQLNSHGHWTLLATEYLMPLKFSRPLNRTGYWNTSHHFLLLVTEYHCPTYWHRETELFFFFFLPWTYFLLPSLFISCVTLSLSIKSLYFFLSLVNPWPLKYFWPLKYSWSLNTFWWLSASKY